MNFSDRQETAGSATLAILQDRREQLGQLVKQKERLKKSRNIVKHELPQINSKKSLF